jgi:hypothetical protein
MALWSGALRVVPSHLRRRLGGRSRGPLRAASQQVLGLRHQRVDLGPLALARVHARIGAQLLGLRSGLGVAGFPGQRQDRLQSFLERVGQAL